MCKTHRYFEAIDKTFVWTLRTVFRSRVLRSRSITFHFAVGHAESCLTIAFKDDEASLQIVSLTLQVQCGTLDLPVDPSFSCDGILNSLAEDTKIATLERLPHELRQFVLEIPTMIELMSDSGADFAIAKTDDRIANLNRTLEAAETC